MRVLPEKGLPAEDILRRLGEYTATDLDPHSGRMWAHSYETGLDEVLEVARRA